MRSNISYKNIAKAIDFYSSRGYEYIEVPWRVSFDAELATASADKKPLLVSVIDGNSVTSDGHLVRSGEQSFIELFLDKSIRPGRYVCATPCFMYEAEDRYRFREFFKVELIDIRINEFMDIPDLSRLTKDAFDFFSAYPIPLNLINVPDQIHQIDILSQNIELGSYGIRDFMSDNTSVSWVYGTGCAEPRLSQAIANSLK